MIGRRAIGESAQLKEFGADGLLFGGTERQQRRNHIRAAEAAKTETGFECGEGLA
jgi:hypothetical protein